MEQFNRYEFCGLKINDKLWDFGYQFLHLFFGLVMHANMGGFVVEHCYWNIKLSR